MKFRFFFFNFFNIIGIHIIIKKIKKMAVFLWKLVTLSLVSIEQIVI